MADPIPHVIVSSAPTGSVPEGAIPISLYGEGTVDRQAAIANINTPGGTFADLAAAQTAVAATNSKVNAILAALRSAGIIAS